METPYEQQLVQLDGAIDVDALSTELEKAGDVMDVPSFERLLGVVVAHNPGTFEGVYRLFEPMLALADKLGRYSRDPKLDNIMAEWSDSLGLSTQENLNRMLTFAQPESRVIWLTNQGADPNAVLDPKSLENLTVIGHVCRRMHEDRWDDNAVAEMIRVVLSRGEMPYSVAPHTEADPDGCDLFRAVMSRRDGSESASGALFQATEEAYRERSLPVDVQRAIGQLCLQPGILAAYEEANFHGNSAYMPLSFARFEDPDDWVKAFNKVGLHARMDTLFYQSPDRQAKRMIECMTQDSTRLDDIPAVITDDRIPCTLLQAAAWCSDKHNVKRLIDAGADPFRKVGAQSDRHPIADLDTIGLWERQPTDAHLEVMQALKARRAVSSVLTGREKAHQASR